MEDLISDIKKHFQHYLVLLIILSFGIIMYQFFRFNQFYQMGAVLTTSLAYVIWGIIHHWLSEDLHIKVVFEYILLALFADFVIFSLFLRI